MTTKRRKSIPQSFRGVDPHLYRWLRVQAVLEEKTIGQKLNELLSKEKAESEAGSATDRA